MTCCHSILMRPCLYSYSCLLRCFSAASGFVRPGNITKDRFLKTLTFLAFAFLAFSSLARPAKQVLQGHVPARARRLAPVERLNPRRQLKLTIGLPLQNREKLTNLLEELYNPSSPNFRHFLSADEFTASFGPSREDYQAVVDFAKSHGLTVRNTHTNRTLVDISGSVADIEKAFNVHMQVYQHPVEARTFFAPDVEPSNTRFGNQRSG